MPNRDDQLVVAVVDVGSTSVHLLVARHTAAASCSFEPLIDASEVLGLGERVHTAGELGTSGIEGLVATLARQLGEATALGARSAAIVATEPLRRARDAALARTAVLDRLRVPLHVLSPDEEALCTLVGVTEGRVPTSEMAVLDIGGGSTELVIAAPGRDAQPFSMSVGAIRLSSTIVTHDPPTASEVEALRDAAAAAVRGAPAWALSSLVAVGGTVTNLARVAAWLHGTGDADPRLSLDDVALVVSHLRATPAETVALETGIRPGRARILVAGAAILEAVLARYGLREAGVSTASLREGLVLLLCAAGDRWGEDLAHLARGWR